MQCSAVQYSAVRGAVQFSAVCCVPCRAVLCCVVCGAVRCGAVLCCALQCCVVLHCAVLRVIVPFNIFLFLSLNISLFFKHQTLHAAHLNTFCAYLLLSPKLIRNTVKYSPHGQFILKGLYTESNIYGDSGLYTVVETLPWQAREKALGTRTGKLQSTIVTEKYKIRQICGNFKRL